MLILNYLLKYSRNVTYTYFRCPYKLCIVHVFAEFCVLLYCYIWFTESTLLSLIMFVLFRLKSNILSCWFYMQITYCFFSFHEAGYGGWCSRSLILPLPWSWGTAYHGFGLIFTSNGIAFKPTTMAVDCPCLKLFNVTVAQLHNISKIALEVLSISFFRYSIFSCVHVFATGGLCFPVFLAEAIHVSMANTSHVPCLILFP